MQEQNASTFLPVAILLASVILGGSLIYAAVTMQGSPANLAGQTGGQSGEEQTSGGQGFPDTFTVDLKGWPSKGSENAPVVIVEYSDFACPFCKRFHDDTLPQLIQEYIDAGKVRFVYKDFPVVGGEKAAEAAHCAADQGKYWEYHDMLFANQTEDRGSWGNVSVHEGYAKELGLNVSLFTECFESGKHQEKVALSTRESMENGGTGTPFFLINDNPIVGAQPFESFKQIIDREL